MKPDVSLDSVRFQIYKELEEFGKARYLYMKWRTKTGPRYFCKRLTLQDMIDLKSKLDEAIQEEGGAKYMKKKKAVSKLKLATTAKAKKALKAKKK